MSPQGSVERITLVDGERPGVGGTSTGEGAHTEWWDRYAASLSRTITSAALDVVDLDSTYILDKCIFGSAAAGAEYEDWPPGRIRRGLVMGAVQSGKTASLMAVAAKALDRGVDVVVILAGTRTALWQQTFERFVEQLDQWAAGSDQERRLKRVLLPSPQAMLDSASTPDLSTLYFETPNLVRRSLKRRRPLIAVVMKQVDHLESFRRYLREVLDPLLVNEARPLHVLVIDDEADDGSILDSEQEKGLSYDSEQLKQIPRHIARLWADKNGAAETYDLKLYATYVAYTATPQANFLQSDHNPLSPSEFVASLRFPFDCGAKTVPRLSTFLEPGGLGAYYTGGLAYYVRPSEGPGALCTSRPFPEKQAGESIQAHQARVAAQRHQLLGDALRAYFVSGAIRLLLSKKSLNKARGAVGDTEESIKSLCPPPHTFLFHPSAKVETHFAGAEEVALWSGCSAADVAAGRLLSAEGLAARLAVEEEAWKKWVGEFEASRRSLSFYPGGEKLEALSPDLWAQLKILLVDEIFPNTRVSVINSDPRGNERPLFNPTWRADGKYVAPEDIFTVFVSGNVMSRGLTLEGLATTLFLRSSDEPASDTQMQMQRWFGYRGRYLHLCRVFLFEDQLRLFRSYHEADEALRSEVLGVMNEEPDRAPRPTVLQGARFRATAKIANLRALPLCPGADPFITPLEDGAHIATNQQVLGALLTSQSWVDLTVAGTLRGKVMQQQLSLLEVADVLDGFRYTNHCPDPDSEPHKRWLAQQRAHKIASPEAPLFRPPKGPTSSDLVTPRNCPYSIAAYLRLWHALLTRPAVGIVPTDNPSTPWSLLNLRDYAASAPKFYVGIRYGSGGKSDVPVFHAHGVQRMDRNYDSGVLRATWGSRNPGEGPHSYLGDQLFDYHVHNGKAPAVAPGEPLWRPRGAPGLLLFHVVRNVAGGGDLVTAGLALPLGGPDHIAALRPGT